jgi:hypothetical protein
MVSDSVLGAARAAVKALGIPCAVASVEDCILLKCVANRPIDRADAVELARIHGPSLDKEYLREWAGRLGVASDVEETLTSSEAPENPY